jgi:hypothetical protein
VRRKQSGPRQSDPKAPDSDARSRSTASPKFFCTWNRSATCTALGAPFLAPAAYSPARSRLMNWTPGCSLSQASSVVAVRSGSKSTSLLVLQVDKKRAIGHIATKGPIIHTKMGWCGMSRERGSADEPQKGVGTARHLQCGGAAGSRFGSDCKSQLSELLGEPNGLACKRQRQFWSPFSKGLAPTTWVVAEKNGYSEKCVESASIFTSCQR